MITFRNSGSAREDEDNNEDDDGCAIFSYKWREGIFNFLQNYEKVIKIISPVMNYKWLQYGGNEVRVFHVMRVSYPIYIVVIAQASNWQDMNLVTTFE